MFSNFYDALNQSVSAVLPEINPNASPTRQPAGPDASSSPRSSMGGRDLTSPPLSRSNTLNGSEAGMGHNTSGAGYSTYQPRRNKPSLEDRLRASLAAKEQKRVVSGGERDGVGLPRLGEEVPSVASPVADGPAGNMENAGLRGQDMQTQVRTGGDLDRARNIALPSSPPLQNAAPFVSQPLKEGSGPLQDPNMGSRVTALSAGDPRGPPQPYVESQSERPQMRGPAQPPVGVLETQKGSLRMPESVEKQPAPQAPAAPLSPPPVQHPAPLQSPTPFPHAEPELHTRLQEGEDPLANADAHAQTITVPPPPPPKHDDPPPSSKYDDPLTPAFLELEREQQAAARKARLPRSPPQATSQPRYSQSQPGSPQFAPFPPPTPSLSPLPQVSSSNPLPPTLPLSALPQPALPLPPVTSPPPTKQQFGHARSKSLVPEGEPFVRFGGSSSGGPSFPLGTSFSLDQVLKKPGVLGGFLELEGVDDEEGLKAWAENMKLKATASQEEVGRLQAKLVQQESRMEELRDTHRLESLSQSELIESLREKNEALSRHAASLETALTTEQSMLSAERSARESLIAAERAKQSTSLSDVDALKAKLQPLEEENEKLRAVAKEEEEKRTKAISLLKTVRTKLVKAEKDRDEAMKELTTLQETVGAGERGKEEELRSAKNELERVREELERTRVESMREVERIREENLREFERARALLESERTSLKDAMEREVLARRGEWEIEGIAAKTAHQKEVANLTARISTLSTSLNQLSEEKSALFSDLQSRTSELESARTQLEDLQSRLTEANFQLHERDEQLTMVQVELSEARRNSAATSSLLPSTLTERAGGTPSGPEIARLLAAAETRSEARVLELRSRLRTIEAERAEQEETWTKSLAARAEEIERLRSMLGVRETEGQRVEDYKAAKDREVEELEERAKALEGEKAGLKRRLKAVEGENEGLREKIEGTQEEIRELAGRVQGLMGSLEEMRGKEAQLKLNNKTLREELRKVQSSAAVLERQRNPGVGYWSASPRTPLNATIFGDVAASSSTPDLSRNATASSQARPGTPGTPSGVHDGRATSVAGSARSSMEANGSVQGEEEVNLEYLRNVVLQFLEHEKMRPNLVRVLSVILKFTPQETRRLIAKV